jgi:hypothetical protein
VRCGSREILPPDLVEQARDRHDIAGAEKQRCEQSPLLRPAELERALPDFGFELAENAKPERF